ncbi:hypothetical protein QF043_004876 [Pseudomonas sp. W3I7]|nr:hypothetical protein [Pseudomonas sp. W3I7]
MKSPTYDKGIAQGSASRPCSIGGLRMWQVVTVKFMHKSQAIKNAQLREELGVFVERKAN